MRAVRLLPIVVCSAAALLVFKSVGILTNGGYVLSGPVVVAAAGGGGHGGGGSEGGEVTLPTEPTISDTTPTVGDPAPTLGQQAEGGGHGEEAAAGDHGAPAPEAGGHDEPGAEAGGHGEAPAADAAAQAEEEPNPLVQAAATDAAAPGADCAVELSSAGAEASGGHGGGTSEAAAAEPECVDMTDAVAVEADGEGGMVELASEDGSAATEKALLARLSERRTQLEVMEAELDMRSALVEAAEKRLQERAATLEGMEARINALMDERKALEAEQFAAVVGMYETMKPAEAAMIFNELDMNVLLRVARKMSPRKMAPILAKMTAEKAQMLTVHLAAIEPEPTVEVQAPSQDLAELPQIVGEEAP